MVVSMRDGFSIINVMLLLVIAGLLAGGVVAVQGMIRAGDVEKLTAEIPVYHTAVNTFRDKYKMLPGDLTHATYYWGQAICPGAPDTFANGTTTCNGNGNNMIEPVEAFRFWQHLANEGMIAGPFSGVPGNEAGKIIPGTNAPAVKLSKSGVGVRYDGQLANHPVLFNGNFGNSLVFATGDLTSADTMAFLKPRELWGIDTKIDDGSPGRGMLRSSKNGCTRSNTDPAIATYYTDSSDKSCSFVSIINF